MSPPRLLTPLEVADASASSDVSAMLAASARHTDASASTLPGTTWM
jgi:hypothetical protein